jgi:hypothetical protein
MNKLTVDEVRGAVMAKSEITQYCATFGPATVERVCSDDKKGWVVMLLKTAKYPHGLELYVTKSGKVRVFGKEGEWMPPCKPSNAAHERQAREE